MKMQLGRSVLLSVLLLLPLHLSAQNRTLTGTVTDAADGSPIVGVTVVVVEVQRGVVTDGAGQYRIEAATGQTLQFSCIGYDSREIVLGGETTVNVQLSETSEVIDEVVVVGYGMQKKASSVGAISAMSGDDLLSSVGVTTVSEALQGQIGGVVAINSTSKPGADAADILIRGKATWQNNSPLILVDGVERDFNDVDMNEIETISVLKDASATAVFGVKGGNGVILITSKRGQKQKTEVNFSANMGLKQPSTKMEWSDYVTSMNMYNEAAANDKAWDKLIPESKIAAWENAYATGNYGPYNEFFPEINWWDETTRKTALQQTYNVNIRGGTEKLRYFTSLGYLSDGDVYKTEKQESYDPSFNYKRYNWRFNADLELTRTTSLSVNVAGHMGYRNYPVYQTDSGNPNDRYFFNPFFTAPTNDFPIKYSDGYWGDTSSGRDNLVANMLTGGQFTQKRFQGFYDFVVDQKLDFITKGLSAKAKVSYTSTSSTLSKIFNNGAFGATSTAGPKQEIRYYRVVDYTNPITNADGSISYPFSYEERFPDDYASEHLPVGVSYDDFDNYSRKFYYELSLNYGRSFGDHNVTAMALFVRRVSEWMQSSNSNKMSFPSYEEDWVGRVTYNWKERYLLEMNCSYTGSENFSPENRFGFFPSFSGGWRVSEEPWMKWDKLNNLKLRYSYGKTGNDGNRNNRFTYVSIYSSSGNANFGLDNTVSYGPLYHEGSVANPVAQWEDITVQNLGVELGLWNKLSITLDLFDEKRDKILMQRNTLASWFGASIGTFNLGKTKSHGLELEVGWRDAIQKKFKYWVNFNMGTSENRVVFRDDPFLSPEYLKLAGKPIGVPTKYLASGNYTSLNDIFNGPQTTIGNFTHGQLVPGDLFFIDFDGDGQITSYDQVPMKQMNYPLTTFSFSFGFDYRNFGFSALLYAVPELYQEAMNLLLWDFPNSNVKTQTNTLTRWTTADIGHSGPKRPAAHLESSHNSAGSTFSYSSHAYLRLKNLEISYSVPKKHLRKAFMTKCQVYANGTNLITFSKGDKRRDPETSGANVYPIVRRYNFGVRLSF